MNISRLRSILLSHSFVILIAGLLLLLLARNPFSERTLIPNFEPFPDSFHYLTTPRCFLAGQGWNLCREGRTIYSSVPPLYSLAILPFLVLNNDPRMFYFTNVLLALTSYLLLTVILKKLKVNPFAICFVLLLFVLNYYSYWLPTLAMAENLLIPLFLMGILLLILPANRFRAGLAGFIAISFYATKYAAAPLVLVYGLSYLVKLLSTEELDSKKLTGVFDKKRSTILIIFVLSGILSLTVLIGPRIFSALLGIISQFQPVTTTNSEVVNQSSSFFSINYFTTHFPQYFSVLFGKSISFLWLQKPLFPTIVGIIGMFGLLLGSLKKHTRLLSLSIIALGLSQIAFMSTFYVVDARYVFTLLPSVLIGVGLFLQTMEFHLEKMNHPKLKSKFWNLNSVLLTFLMICTLAISAKPLKAQIGLNLKYSETPWWYLSINQMNQFFEQQPPTSNLQPPVLITAIPPFLVDFYSTGKYQLLPLSTDHDFRGNRAELFGDFDYSDLIKLYEQQISEGREVYVTNYGLGNEQPRINDFENLQSNFKLELLQEGCHGLCNVWRISR